VSSSASFFTSHYLPFSLSSSSNYLQLLRPFAVTCCLAIFSSIMCFIVQFLHKMWPIQLVLSLVIVCRIFLSRSRDSIVNMANRYGLDGPGIESRLEVTFSAPVQTGPAAHPAPYTMGTRFFPAVKRPGHGFEFPPPSSAEVKKRVQLHLKSPSGQSWFVLGWTVLLPVTLGYFCPPWSLGILNFSLDWFIWSSLSRQHHISNRSTHFWTTYRSVPLAVP